MGARAVEPQRIARIHELETRRNKGIHRLEVIHRDEEKRRIQLQYLSAREETDRLKDKFSQRDTQYRSLLQQSKDTRRDLDEGRRKIQNQESKLKKQHAEICQLKAEVDSFGSSLQDSGKVLQEKFALIRELDRLRPELEHLQSQLSNHQQVVADKHKLQRQLDTLEVELENEKRSKQKVRERDNGALVAELRSRADDAEKQLAAEKKERDKLKKKQEAALAEVINQRGHLEEQVSDLKAQLQELQGEGQGEPPLEPGPKNPVETKHKRAAAPVKQARKKRKAAEAAMEESALQTPEHDHQIDRRPPKKRAGEHAPLGEKSHFSITPFLKRNKDAVEHIDQPDSPNTNAAPEAQDAEEVEAEELPHSATTGTSADESDPEPPLPKAKYSEKLQASKPRGRPKSKPLEPKLPSKADNATQSCPSPRASQPAPDSQIDSSFEDKENTNVNANVAPGKAAPNTNADLGAQVAGDANGKKKKRKLLGANTTLFDDDDKEAVSNVAAPQVGQIKRKRAPLGGASNAFGAASFSPLKRDRRGVGASFLG